MCTFFFMSTDFINLLQNTLDRSHLFESLAITLAIISFSLNAVDSKCLARLGHYVDSIGYLQLASIESVY